jgi:hypothetical protein
MNTLAAVIGLRKSSVISNRLGVAISPAGMTSKYFIGITALADSE